MMRIRANPWSVFGAVVLVFLLACAALYSYLFWKVKTIHFLSSSPAVNAIAQEVKPLTDKARAGAFPWRKVDHTSVGSPQSEASLLQLRNGIDFFANAFGHPPAEAQDLARMSTLPKMSSNQKHLYQSLANDCQILTLQRNSYILNCDHWNSPPRPQIDDLVRSFDPETEKFYSLQDHEVLYFPPAISGKRLASASYSP